MVNRDYAEKQDLWSEMNELWVNRQLRRRKLRLSALAMVSVLLMAGTFLYKASIAPQDPLYLQVQGQALEVETSVKNSPAARLDQRDDVIETTETLSI